MPHTDGQERTWTALYVSHVPAEVAPVALLVDFLEAAVPALEGHIACSALPGYPSVPEGGRALGALCFPGDDGLGAAEAAALAGLRRGGARLRLLSFSPLPTRAGVPADLCDLPLLSLNDGILGEIVEDLAAAVARRCRTSTAAERARSLLLLSLAGDPSRDASVPPAPPRDAGRVGTRISSMIPRAHAPSALLFANAGAALGEAVFRGTFAESELQTLDGDLGELVQALGGDWHALRQHASGNALLRSIDGLLARQPEVVRDRSRWYDAGYQLVRFGQLCARELQAEPSGRRQWAESRRRAWNAFWGVAGALPLGEHTLTALNALFEDASAPGGPRMDLPQCLEVLRDAAFDADCRRRIDALDDGAPGAFDDDIGHA